VQPSSTPILPLEYGLAPIHSPQRTDYFKKKSSKLTANKRLFRVEILQTKTKEGRGHVQTDQ
jgi:hypothetical protein